MKKLSLAAAVLALSATIASGADLPARAPVPYTKAPAAVQAAYNWSGFYAGINGGGGFGTTGWDYSISPNNANHNISGGMAGGQIGYNWQFAGPWVVGFEADGDWADVRGSTNCPNAIYVCTSEARALASFRGRVGVAFDNVLIYGTGGAGYADSHYTALINGVTPGAGSGYFDADRWGYAAGAGIEWAFIPSWSLKVEYMHYGFGTVTAPPSALGGSSPNLRLDVDTVKAGINYHFNLAAMHY
jgi:outer membrane immunogenic protein